MGTRVGILVGALVASSCASAPKMNASAPIEKQSAFLGTSYEQRGEPIDRADMLEKLGQEPEASEELSGAGAFSTIAVRRPLIFQTDVPRQGLAGGAAGARQIIVASARPSVVALITAVRGSLVALD